MFVLAFLLSVGVRALDGPVRRRPAQACTRSPAGRDARVGRFLYLIAALNLVILVGIFGVFREMRGGRF